MEESEAIRRTRNSLKAKKSKAEILRGFEKRGYRLEYAEAILKKAEAPKNIFMLFFILALAFITISSLTYSVILTNEKQELLNPLASYDVESLRAFLAERALEEITGGVEVKTLDDFQIKSLIDYSNETLNETYFKNNSNEEQTIGGIEITPEFITFVLNEIGAYNLHKNPLTLEDPKINFKIDNQEFTSIITSEIDTIEGYSDSPDIEFITTKDELIEIVSSDASEELTMEKISNGKIKVNLVASEAELFSKGYLNLYKDFT